MSKSGNYYNRIFARNYDRFTTAGYYDYEKEVDEFRKIVKGGQLLELGIGTGCLAELLIKEGYTVEGIEPSKPMIRQLERKGLPIRVYEQDASDFNTGKRYDAIFTHGAVPMTVLRKEGVCFDTYIVDKPACSNQMRNAHGHLKEKGMFLCGVQSEGADNATIGDFYRSNSVRKGDILVKTHFFREEKKWASQTVTARIWPEREFLEMMKGTGFETVGLNESRTWYVFVKD